MPVYVTGAAVFAPADGIAASAGRSAPSNDANNARMPSATSTRSRSVEFSAREVSCEDMAQAYSQCPVRGKSRIAFAYADRIVPSRRGAC